MRIPSHRCAVRLTAVNATVDPLNATPPLPPVESGTTSGSSATVLQQATASWAVNQWVGYYLEYTSGPAAGQFLLIASNTPTTITTAVSFSPAPTPGGGDSFVVSPSTPLLNVSWDSADAPSFPLCLENVKDPDYGNLLLPVSVAHGNVVLADNGQTKVLGSLPLQPALSAITSGSTPNVLSQAGATWGLNQWVGYYLEYNSGPASGQSMPITANTPNTITTAAAFSPAPTPTGGDSFSIVSPGQPDTPVSSGPRQEALQTYSAKPGPRGQSTSGSGTTSSSLPGLPQASQC